MVAVPIRGLTQWFATQIVDFNFQLENYIVDALLHLMCTHGPTDEDIGFLSRDSLPIARRDYKVKELKLFPYTRVIGVSMPESGMFTQVEATVGDSRVQTFYLAGPERVANPKRQGKGMPKLSPFWNASFVGEESEVDGLVDLKFCKQTFTVALQVNSKNQKKQDDQFKT